MNCFSDFEEDEEGNQQGVDAGRKAEMQEYYTRSYEWYHLEGGKPEWDNNYMGELGSPYVSEWRNQ